MEGAGRALEQPRLFKGMITLLLFLSLFFASCSPSRHAPNLIQPEASSGFREVARSRARASMVTTANPESTRAALEVLKAGGSAVDATIAAHMALTVVEPQSSGIGGGGFLLHFDAASKSFQGFDGRETAPAQMQPDVFLVSGEPMNFMDAVVGGLAVGVPGAVPALAKAHEKYGKLPWSRLVAPAIKLAREGWNVHPRLYNALQTAPAIKRYAGAESMFFDAAGNIRRPGRRVRNPDLAVSLEDVAARKGRALLDGRLAEQMLSVIGSADLPGLMNAGDLHAYSVVQRSARCVPYRSYRICAFPAPAGSLLVVTILELLERFDLSSMKPLSVEFFHVFAQASELAYADRDRYFADPEFANVPTDALLSPVRLAEGSGKITLGTRSAEPLEMKRIPVKRKRHPVCSRRTEQKEYTIEKPGTSHISVVDAQGNAVSFTASVENNFGSQTMAGGFVLNNQLTDFEFEPCEEGALKANAAEPGKRPRSSMSPIIVLDSEDRAVLVLGSPGGAAIIAYVAQTVIGVLDWGMDPQRAVALPNAFGRKGFTVLETHPKVTPKLIAGLERLGHRVKSSALTSGLSVVARTAHGFAGGADPRRDGLAAGQ